MRRLNSFFAEYQIINMHCTNPYHLFNSQLESLQLKVGMKCMFQHTVLCAQDKHTVQRAKTYISYLLMRTNPLSLQYAGPPFFFALHH